MVKFTTSIIQSTISRHAKDKEDAAHQEEIDRFCCTNPERILMLALADKDTSKFGMNELVSFLKKLGNIMLLGETLPPGGISRYCQ